MSSCMHHNACETTTCAAYKQGLQYMSLACTAEEHGCGVVWCGVVWCGVVLHALQ